MRLAIGICVLAATLWSAHLWNIDTDRGAVSATVIVVIGLGVAVLAWGASAWLRKRWRRRMLNMRGSALW